MAIYGFISDVHGNLPALRMAVDACRRRGAERLVFLGDSLGRGDSDACARLIQETAELSVVGNRDLDWADRVGSQTREYVLGLPRFAEAGDFVAVHGYSSLTPVLSTDDLRRGFSRSYTWLRERKKRLLFFGHSHQSRTWRKRSLHEPPERLSGARQHLPREAETVYLVNVGTTGLPFPGKDPPACLVYDDQELWIEHLLLGAGVGRAPEAS